jgi:hypothetical protein
MSLQTISFNEELDKFYSETFYFSYSSINKLLFSPRMFYDHYVLKQKEDSIDAHLVTGRALHCLLLEPDNFNNQFIVIPGKIPADNNLIIVTNIFNKCYVPMNNNSLSLEDFSEDILTQLLSLNLHQSLVDDKKDSTKTGDSKRLEKILTEQNKEYFNFLKKREGKTVIDQQTLDNCTVSVELLKNHPQVKSLLQLNVVNTEGITTINEVALTMQPGKYKFGFKGILDNVVIDYNKKTLFINDLKTTGKALQDFPEAVEYYKYWIQAVIYQQLVWSNYLKKLPDIAEWKIVITFIVIDKFNQIYPFQVSNETLAIWQEDFLDMLKVIDYHYTEKDFTLPYDLAKGNVIL